MFWDYVLFWAAKHFLGVMLVSGLIFIAMASNMFTKVKQRVCKHSTFYEDRSCHAICNTCKKDLGFIGNLHRVKK